MTTINVNAGGVLNLSSGAEEGLPITTQDELQAKWFKSGWDAAVTESLSWFAQDKIVEFYRNAGIDVQQSKDEPHGLLIRDDEPGPQDDYALYEDPKGDPEEPYTPMPSGFGTLSAVVVSKTGEYDLWDAVEKDAITKVDGSGEPEAEKNQTWDPADDGTWTISAEELQSRLDAAFKEGEQQGFRKGTDHKEQTTARSLRIIASELNHQLFPNGYEGETKGSVLGTFSIALAKRLGWEVSE